MASIETRTDRSGTIRYRVHTRAKGRQIVRTFADQGKAQRWARLAEVDIDAALDVLARPEAATERTVSEHVRHHIEHLPKISIGTRSDYLTYARDIDARLGHLPLSALTRDAVTAWVIWLSTVRDLAPKSIKHRQTLLSAALRVAVRDDLISRNVAEGVELPKPTLEQTQEMVTLTQAEIMRLLQATGAHWRPLVSTLVGTGIRIGEATALQVGDIDLEKRQAHIQRAWKHTDGHGHLLGLPKNGKPRTIYLGALVQILAPLVEGRAAGDWLFTNTRGNVVRRDPFYDGPWTNAVHQFAGDTKTAGAPKDGRRPITWERGPGKHPRIHDLRHTYASIKLAEGKSLPWLQRQLGHASITTTVGTYGHLRTADLAQLGDVLDWSPALLAGRG